MSNSDRASAVVVWRFSDGRPGHDNQSLGLIDALARRVPLQHHTLEVPSAGALLRALLTRRYAPGAALPRPTLLIGAGHATHLPMLAARRACGGRVVVLMKPSLPRRWFDLCVIPQHDAVAPGDGVILTQGAMNRVVRSTTLDAGRGLLLIGGQSAHYQWNDAEVLRQLSDVVGRCPEIAWQIADSRRTPATMREALRGLQLRNAEFVHYEDVGGDWLREALSRSATVWVTPDSVSMLYEALTAGAAVGLLELPARAPSRIEGGLAALVERGDVRRYSQWRIDRKLQPARTPLEEASRCAEWILAHWLSR
ncbi:MAG: mitochondrial fission ELM1 family protein [Gammaproteobacteria bacterium]